MITQQRPDPCPAAANPSPLLKLISSRGQPVLQKPPEQHSSLRSPAQLSSLYGDASSPSSEQWWKWPERA